MSNSKGEMTRCISRVQIKLLLNWHTSLNRFLRERGMASNPKMEYQIFPCIFQKNSAMATLAFEGNGKISLGMQGKKLAQLTVSVQFGYLKTGQTFFPTFSKKFSHFLQNPRQPQLSKIHWENAKKVWYHEKWVGRMPLFLLEDLF